MIKSRTAFFFYPPTKQTTKVPALLLSWMTPRLLSLVPHLVITVSILVWRVGESSAYANTHNSDDTREPVHVRVPRNAEEHLVTDLPLLDRTSDPFATQHWAGLLPASNDGTKYLFYWLFAPDVGREEEEDEEAATDDDDDLPLIIWLNGGPGCSSLIGLFVENGPFRFVLTNPQNRTSPWKLIPSEQSWHQLPAYMMYIDQPVGTGLSFVQQPPKTTTGNNDTSTSSFSSFRKNKQKMYASNDFELNTDLYYFLQQFFRLHSDKFVATTATTTNQKRLNRPFYFAGESNAGHIIPSMMSYIVKQNSKIHQDKKDSENNNNNVIIGLNGAAIGNGWVDPYYQYASARAAYGHGIIDDIQLNALNIKEKRCQQKLKKNKYNAAICFDLMTDIIDQSYGEDNEYEISPYDVTKLERKKSKEEMYPVGKKTVEAYLGTLFTGSEGGTMTSKLEEVLTSIHAYEGKLSGHVFKDCALPPYDALRRQDGRGVVGNVIHILEYNNTRDALKTEGERGANNIQLLFYNGMNDLVCDHVGNELFLNKMEWKNQKEWISSNRYAWTAPSEKLHGKVNGYMKEYKNLYYLKLLNAGHMVPMDIPNVAFDMMQIFISMEKGSSSNSKTVNGKKSTSSKYLSFIHPNNTQKFNLTASLSSLSIGGSDSNSNNSVPTYFCVPTIAYVLIFVVISSIIVIILRMVSVPPKIGGRERKQQQQHPLLSHRNLNTKERGIGAKKMRDKNDGGVGCLKDSVRYRGGTTSAKNNKSFHD